MAALKVDVSGLHAAATGLRAAAHILAQLGAKPLAHPALATDETSMSAAARLSEHGSVAASRAADAAAVLNSAADAIVQATQSYTAMDTANATLVSLKGNPAPATTSPTPAVTTDLTAAHIPMAPPIPRPAESTAAIMEAGNSSAGSPFTSGCTALGEAFGDSARSARSAAGAVGQHLKGAAGPTISAALNRYAQWSDTMTQYTHSLKEMAGDHKERFSQAQHDTPSTQDFTDRHRELQHAISTYNAHPTPGAAQAVSKSHSNLNALTNRTHVVSGVYRTGEEPAIPSGPPRVVPIVNTDGGQDDSPPSTGQDGADPTAQPGKAKGSVSGDDDSDDAIADPSDDDDDDGDLGAGLDTAASGTPLGAGTPGMANELPNMLTGLLGGMVGMAASIPEKLGQEAQQFVQQAAGAASGLASGLNGKDKLDDTPGDLADSFGGGGGGGDDGGGATTPASDGGAADLKPAASAMGSAEPSVTPMAGLSPTGPSTPSAAAAGAGGAPMFMPPMGGMGSGAGGGATREVKDPDKTITTPTRPNSEAVKGERRDPIRHTATVETDSGPPTGGPAKRAVRVNSRTRRAEQPDNKQ